jgi:carboxyl-terminal processing protease
MKHRFPVLLILVVISSSLLGGFWGGDAAADPGSSGRTSRIEFLASYTEVLDIIQQNYVDEIGPDKLVYSSIKGMLRVLDPHSVFFDPKEFSKLREEQHSKYFGLGIKVRPQLRDRGKVVILEPPNIGSPAERSGLRVGDVIAKIEGESIDDWTSDEVVNHLRGPRGTSVNITVERPGIRDPLQFKVERDEIPIVTVPYAFEVKPGIGYVRIDRFSESTSDELRAKLKEINAGNLSGLILDLRDNPGGLLNQAIEVSDFFVPYGQLVVSTKGRVDGSAKDYKAPSSEKAHNSEKIIKVPLVVLINRHSASASEIVAGALQDHDRALIVGETSFGKGLVQTVYTLENSTGMALTTAKYYTPSGRLIQRDYSGSITEYYYMDGDSAPISEKNTNREIKETEHGRKVYGGGGITPDIIESMRDLNRFEGLLANKEVFFQYARRLTSGQVPSAKEFELQSQNNQNGGKSPKSMPDLEVTEAVLSDFKAFLKEKAIDFTDEDIQNNVDFIKRRIRNEAYISLFGLQEGFRVAVQGDTQVIKALEVMPEAKLLMTSSRINAPAVDNQIR